MDRQIVVAFVMLTSAKSIGLVCLRNGSRRICFVDLSRTLPCVSDVSNRGHTLARAVLKGSGAEVLTPFSRCLCRSNHWVANSLPLALSEVKLLADSSYLPLW